MQKETTQEKKFETTAVFSRMSEAVDLLLKVSPKLFEHTAPTHEELQGRRKAKNKAA
ncbi:hypothetical protein [Celerinatantimonas diazotrophica]|uniref:Uncharacterized protein n=1 Tax=Celerinatantimonas diazotrophica TaxID=412034 RepID=A0A4R1K4G2_9GAMM|nr:hypothetical protein [Celerinatantimonas diazotrophica]TCK59025.1 hypothetical protein EV690_1189 [Celerinatantimonas diazotrophica]CAG9297660.1 hypothetical protein CEDIAZO_02849 [Celerinatantimonas diazotrophica]